MAAKYSPVRKSLNVVKESTLIRLGRRPNSSWPSLPESYRESPGPELSKASDQPSATIMLRVGISERGSPNTQLIHHCPSGSL